MIRRKKYECYVEKEPEDTADMIIDSILENTEKVLYGTLFGVPLIGVVTMSNVLFTAKRSISLLLKNTVINNQPNAKLFKKYREKIDCYQQGLDRVKDRYEHPETKKRIAAYGKKGYEAMENSKYKNHLEAFKQYNSLENSSEYCEFLETQIAHGKEHITNDFCIANWHNRNKIDDNYKNYVFLCTTQFRGFYDEYKKPYGFVNLGNTKDQIHSTTIHEAEHYFQFALTGKRHMKEYDNSKNWLLTPVDYGLFQDIAKTFTGAKYLEKVYTPRSKEHLGYTQYIYESYYYSLLLLNKNYYQLNFEILARIREIQSALNKRPGDEFTTHDYSRLCRSNNKARNKIRKIITSKKLFIEFMNKVY